MRNVPSFIRSSPWLILLAIGGAHAASTCYDDQDYPAIAALAPKPSGYAILLSGVYRKSGMAPVLEFSSSGWKASEPEPCPEGRCVRETRGCKVQLPEIPLPKAQEVPAEFGRPEGMEQRVSACVEEGRYVYFGIGFYLGEGQGGLGGVGRYDKQTRKMEIRRPKRLRATGVTHIASDSKYLWVGTGNQGECIGMMPTEGLLRYDWTSDRLDPADPSGQGMCGFMVRGLLVKDRTLVVATDVGLALGTGAGLDAPLQWRHLIPDLSAPGLMRETTCDALYEKLLRTVSRKDDGMGWSSFGQLKETLEKWNPKLLERYNRTETK
jgi:hypothetical protein